MSIRKVSSSFLADLTLLCVSTAAMNTLIKKKIKHFLFKKDQQVFKLVYHISLMSYFGMQNFFHKVTSINERNVLCFTDTDFVFKKLYCILNNCVAISRKQLT